LERSTDLSSPKIALLIDFDNVILGIDDPGFDVQLVVNALRERGQIVLGRCYGDWYRHNRHRRNLMEHGLELVETPAFGPVIKNSADIRIALDGYEIGMTQHHIDTFCIVSGDSDFLPLIKKLQFLGKKVLVICGSRFTSDMVRRNCNEFISYENLLAASVGATEDATTLDGAFALLDRAMTALREAGRDIRTSTLKQMMLQLNPVFSERSFGCSQFRYFLDKAVARKLVKYGPRDRTSGELHVLLPDEDEAPLVERVEARTRTRNEAKEPKAETKVEVEQPTEITAEIPAAESPKPVRSAKTDEESLYPRYDRAARRERRYSREAPLRTTPPVENETATINESETTPVIAALDKVSTDQPTTEDFTDHLLTSTELLSRGLRRGKLKYSAKTGKTEILEIQPVVTEVPAVEPQEPPSEAATEVITETASAPDAEATTVIAETSVEATAEAVEEKSKKKPARRRSPRKKTEAATVTEAETEVEAAPAAPEVVSEVAPSPEEAPVPAPKTRTRTRRTTKATPVVSVEETPNSGEATIETATASSEDQPATEEKPKKKPATRRRTTKKKTEEPVS
jgi:uncharacterized protein (TIGR00288 family)